MTLRTLAVAALLYVAIPTPATADPVGWQYAHCATGEITEYYIPRPYLVPTVTVEGWIHPCAAVEPSSSFGIMYLTPAVNVIAELHPYDSPTGSTEFTVRFPFSPLAQGWWDEYGTVRAICLVHGPTSWLGCVRIEPGTNGPPLVTPWTPTRFDLCARVEIIPTGEVHTIMEPNCGTCV